MAPQSAVTSSRPPEATTPRPEVVKATAVNAVPPWPRGTTTFQVLAGVPGDGDVAVPRQGEAGGAEGEGVVRGPGGAGR